MTEGKEQDKDLVGERLERCVSDSGPAKVQETQILTTQMQGCMGSA